MSSEHDYLSEIDRLFISPRGLTLKTPSNDNRGPSSHATYIQAASGKQLK